MYCLIYFLQIFSGAAIVYAKNKNKTNIYRIELDESTLKQYRNPDNDPRGNWRQLGVWSRGTQGGSEYEFMSKFGKKFSKRKWLVNKESMEKLEKGKKLIFVGDKIYRKLFLTENKGKIPETLWDDTSNAANAADEIKKIFGAQIFDTAKPTPYIKRMIVISTNKNDLILDFFAGSGTTAHAVLELNKEDDGNRKFITVQIPEKNESESKNEYPTIADICKERIRRVIKNLKSDKQDLDLGFKVFKLAKSNYKVWEDYKGKNTEKLKEQMRLFENPLISKYRDVDVIYECIIKEGLDLNSKIEKIMTKPNMVYRITDDRMFYICLDKTVTKQTVTDLNLSNNDTFVCIDAALDDSQKTNISMMCRLKTV